MSGNGRRWWLALVQEGPPGWLTAGAMTWTSIAAAWAGFAWGSESAIEWWKAAGTTWASLNAASLTVWLGYKGWSARCKRGGGLPPTGRPVSDEEIPVGSTEAGYPSGGPGDRGTR